MGSIRVGLDLDTFVVVVGNCVNNNIVIMANSFRQGHLFTRLGVEN